MTIDPGAYGMKPSIYCGEVPGCPRGKRFMTMTGLDLLAAMLFGGKQPVDNTVVCDSSEGCPLLSVEEKGDQHAA